MSKGSESIKILLFICISIIVLLYLHQQGFFDNGIGKDTGESVKADKFSNTNPLIHNISESEKQRIIKEHYMPIIKKNKPIGPAFGFHEYFDKMHGNNDRKALGWRNWWLRHKTDYSKLPHDPNFKNIAPIHQWKMDRYIS